MRAIKFRAWDKYHGRMIDVDELVFHEYTEVYDHFLDETRVFMQFTGLTDKNGKEIYEGDIVKAPHDYGPGGFHERTFVVDYDVERGYRFNCWLMGEAEIIGNIYQNPDLIPP